MTEQLAPAWAPPTPDAHSSVGIPLAPPANYPQSHPPQTPASVAGRAAPAVPHAAPPPPPPSPSSTPAPPTPLEFAPPPPLSAPPRGWASAPPPAAAPVVDGPAPLSASQIEPSSLLIDGTGGAITYVDEGVSYDPVPAHHSSPATPAGAAPSSVVDALGTWWSPGVALVVAMAAVAWQLIATYGRERLPAQLDSGKTIDNFDSLVDSLPMASSGAGQLLGFMLVLASGALLYVGWQRGARDLGVQFAVGIVGVVALFAPFVLVKF